jgi:putative LysE/RhtB family amino acid efflux pump
LEASVAQLFLMGLVIGTIVAAPIGPIGTATFVETVAGNYRIAVAGALGCVSAELVFLLIAVLGVIHFNASLAALPRIFHLLVGLAILLIGIYYLMATRAVQFGRIATFLVAFKITAFNPSNLAVLVSLIVAMGAASKLNSATHDIIFMLGEFLGVVLTWAGLIGLGWRLQRSARAKRAVPWLRRGVAFIMIIAGSTIVLQQILQDFPLAK